MTTYWKPDRLPVGPEAEDGTDKRSYIRMDATPLHYWAGNAKVKVNSASITFDTVHAWSCTSRDVELFSVGSYYNHTTWNTRPPKWLPGDAGWNSPLLAAAPVNVGRPGCGDDGTANNVGFTGGNLARMVQLVTDRKWDVFHIGLFPDPDHNDTRNWKVFEYLAYRSQRAVRRVSTMQEMYQ